MVVAVAVALVEVVEVNAEVAVALVRCFSLLQI